MFLPRFSGTPNSCNSCGTYARKFSCAASFGPEMPWIEMPEWAGGMHGPDETVPEELLKKAFKIYALTIARLMELDL